MSDLSKQLRLADERGLSPPQNWTSRAVHEIEIAEAALAEKDAQIAKLREGFASLLPGLVLDLRYAEDEVTRAARFASRNDNARMKVLIGCEFSGVVRDAFAGFGHDAWSCDLLETERPGQHIVGSVLDHLNEDWDLAVFHPPCTYLTNSGVRWLYKGGRGNVIDKARWALMVDAERFFDLLWRSGIPKICIENPIPHAHAKLPAYSQIVHPWWFGHGETKATCLWLKNLPVLIPTEIVQGRWPKVHFESPGPDRWKRRSRTAVGLADAMASQWTIKAGVAR